MKVSVTFDMSPEEAIELMQGTSSAFKQEITEHMAKGLAEGMTSSCVKNMTDNTTNSLGIFDWWKNK